MAREDVAGWRARIALQTLRLASRAAMRSLDVLARVWPDQLIPSLVWPLPAGPHAVGVCDAEAAGLALQIWYPAASVEGFQRRALLRTSEPNRLLLPPRLLRSISSTKTFSYENALVQASGDRRWPVVLFSHGFGGTPSQNTHLAEHLASHGYVVIAISHASGGASMSEAMREATENNPRLFERSRALQAAKMLDDRLEALRVYVDEEPFVDETSVWVSNIRSVITELASGRVAPDVLHAADLTQLGVCGMSFGGSAAAHAAHVDLRIKAAVNLDGGQMRAELMDRKLRTPLLLLHSEAARSPDGGSYNDFHYEPWAQAGADSRIHRYIVSGAGHLSFTDLALFGRGIVRRVFGTSRIDGARATVLVADTTRRFLDLHLKGIAAALDDVRERWPELQPIDLSPIRAWAQEKSHEPNAVRSR